MSRPRSVRGFRLTPRDREMVRWIGRLRMATAAQVAERFELGRAVSYARLGGLVQLGLLEHARIFHAAPGIYLATRSGLAVAGIDLPPAKVDIRTYAHDIELTSVVMGLEREFGASRLVTEREMRAVDTALGTMPRDHPRFAVQLTGARGQLQLTPVGHPRLHFPDCALPMPGSRGSWLAIELERSPKGRARLRTILSAYVASRHIEAVRYLVTNERVRDLVCTEVEALRAWAFVSVESRSCPSTTAPAAAA